MTVVRNWLGSIYTDIIWKFKLLLISIVSLLPLTASAQPAPSIYPEAELFTIREGLSQTRVNNCFTDSYGFLWVGTNDGLNRYDGYKFKVFRSQPYDTTSLSNDNIHCIAEGNSGNLWIGTNKGLNQYVRQTGDFKRYRLSEELKNVKIEAVYPDGRGMVWIKSPHYLHGFNPLSGEIVSYEHFHSTEKESFVDVECKIIEDINGLLWFGSMEGLFSFNRETAGFNHYFHDPLDPLSLSSNEVRTLYEDVNGELWVGTANGINKYDRIHNTFKSYFPDGSRYYPSPFNIINSIIEDDSGVLWICSKQGLSKFYKRSSKFEVLSAVYVHNSALSLSSTNSACLDQSKILWIGGFQGLFKIDLKPRKFRLYNSSLTSVPSLSSDDVSAIYKDKENRLWIGLWNNGLDLIDRKKGSIKHFSKDNPDQRALISSNQIMSFYKDSQGLLWIGSSEGIDISEEDSEVFHSFWDYFKPIPSDLTEGRRVFAITEDNRRDLWIGTDKGVYRYQRRINMLTSYNRIYNNKRSKEIGPVHSIIADKDNSVWLGTANHGLICFDMENNVFFSCAENQDDAYPWSSINCLLKDRNGLIWIGTQSGLTSFDPEENAFLHFTEKDGLPNNYVYSILEDHNRKLWISTNKGLSAFDMVNREFTNYGLAEGLQSYEFNLGSVYQGRDGEMFFGGIAGFNSFYPQKLPLNPRVPSIAISRIELIDAKDSYEIPVNIDNQIISIKLNESFVIDFAALDFTNPDRNSFKYSLTEKGKNPSWIFIGNQHSLTFSNLSPGEYTLRLTGSNNDQIWNTIGASITLNVEAPFWRTRTAYIFFFIIISVLIYAVFRIRTQSLRKSNKILRERDIIAREVEKQKEILSRRNKNIEDSLKYAQRIQKAMLTTPRLFNSILPESFVLHKPKDIVSGDFYWISEVDEKVFVAAVDCTGHGVPGAFMSLIGFELFRKIINTQGIMEPGSILNALNSNFEDIFGNIGDISLKDGMDLAFCVLNKRKMVLEFSGAFNPLYLIRDNKLIEIKGDRFSIGADSDPEDQTRKVFKTHRFRIKPEDMIYILTDGYADQFGGPEGKKFKYRRLRHLLLSIHKLSPDQQMAYLDESIEEWRGSLEQIDDILVIGIKPKF